MSIKTYIYMYCRRTNKYQMVVKCLVNQGEGAGGSEKSVFLICLWCEDIWLGFFLLRKIVKTHINRKICIKYLST
jgi:hypothetical protein